MSWLQQWYQPMRNGAPSTSPSREYLVMTSASGEQLRSSSRCVAVGAEEVEISLVLRAGEEACESSDLGNGDDAGDDGAEEEEESLHDLLHGCEKRGTRERNNN
eukprot:767504-Hanusia_phi.AAC.1